MQLSDCITYLEALYRRPIRPAAEVGLRRGEFILERLGNPHRAFRSVHVTGSSGKGSTTTMAGAILQASGYRSGVFRSPHLTSYLERIVVDGEEISEREWVDRLGRVRAIVEEMERGDLGRASLFEVLWSTAALHFAERGVEFAAVEVGLGGRLDPTNVLESEVAVVTNVSLEHTNVLGPSETDIAGEKAAIIKAGSAAVSAATQPEVRAVVEQRCRHVGAPLWSVGADVEVETLEDGLHGQTIRVQTPDADHGSLRIRLLGAHQAVNAACAVAAMDHLRRRGFSIPEEAIRSGLAAADLPGRLEIVSGNPLIVLDGARNGATAAALRSALDHLFPGRRVVLLIGVLGDKDAEAIVDVLAPLARAAVVTRPPFETRIGDLSRLTEALAARVQDVTQVDDVEAALNMARTKTAGGDILLVTGSLYLVAAVRELLVARRESIAVG